MTNLTDLLERTADRIPVGPPPLPALYAGVARHRRRRTAGLCALATAAVVAVIAGTSLLPSHRSPAPAVSPAVPATRLVGFGHAVIAVPADWPTNKAYCGTPTQDTVLVDDASAALFCLRYRANGVDSVQLSGTPRSDFHADETFEIDGVRAERQRTTCSTAHYPEYDTTICGGTVGIPAIGVWFRAESSTSADEVDRMLARITIAPDRTGVPSYLSQPRSGAALTGADFGHVLEKAGLKPAFRTVRSPGYPAGTILSVSPGAGTVLAPGSTVTVTVAR